MEMHEETVEIIYGGEVIGNAIVRVGEGATGIQMAAMVRDVLKFRVNGETFTREDIQEWWA